MATVGTATVHYFLDIDEFDLDKYVEENTELMGTEYIGKLFVFDNYELDCVDAYGTYQVTYKKENALFTAKEISVLENLISHQERIINETINN